VENDLKGSGGLISWIGLVATIYIVGSVIGLQGPAKLLIFLIVLVYVVKNQKNILSISTQLTNTTPTTSSGQGSATLPTGSTGTPKAS
jgi:hypothetical protein